MQLFHRERDRNGGQSSTGKRFVCGCDWEIDLAWEYMESFTGQNYRPTMASLVSTKNDGDGLGPA